MRHVNIILQNMIQKFFIIIQKIILKNLILNDSHVIYLMITISCIYLMKIHMIVDI